MSTMDLAMQPESGVHPLKPREKTKKRSRSPRIQGYIEKFAAFKPGDSFFVAGVTRKDMEFLRAPFRDAGLGMLMRELERDEVYGVAGVRVWRQPGEYDEL